MKVEVTPKASQLELKPQTVTIAAGGSQELVWDVTAPAQLAFAPQQQIEWEIAAKDTAGSNASDALKISQRIVLPAIPVTVQQATLVQVNGTTNLSSAPPPQSLAAPGQTAARGGVKSHARAHIGRWLERRARLVRQLSLRVSGTKNHQGRWPA